LNCEAEERVNVQVDQQVCLHLMITIQEVTSNVGGPVSSVGIATVCGLDVSGIESQWGQDFPLLALGLTSPRQARSAHRWRESPLA
jgi:hypothetical protein